MESKKIINKNKKRLLLCVLLDLVGYISFVVPFFDFIWAPLSAIIMMKLFKSRRGKYAAIISFIEEIFPYTDIIPTFTAMYFYEKFLDKRSEKK